MPELPDLAVYLTALERRVLGQTLQRVRVANPFVLRTAVPPLQSVNGRTITALQRLGKRLVFVLDDQLRIVLHLMVAGRLHWRGPGAKLVGRPSLAAFDFAAGTLVLTEAGTTKRASLHLVPDEQSLRAYDPGGLEVLSCPYEVFAAVLARHNHTVKRALTDPHLFSGIGNAYSDEILHAAKLSPLALTQRLSGAEIERLYRAVQTTLTRWIDALRTETGPDFPENVTAFHPGMAVHGKFGQPCPVCGGRVQRIRYAENETNYCPGCQNSGKLLADRGLSRLLKKDWPKTPEELEEFTQRISR